MTDQRVLGGGCRRDRAVGQEMLRVLAERASGARTAVLASARSAETGGFKGASTSSGAHAASFGGRIALFAAASLERTARSPCAPGDLHRQYQRFSHEPRSVVVPEVNSTLRTHQGSSAPNCSTIQMVVVLKPLHDAARIRRVIRLDLFRRSGAGRGDGRAVSSTRT